MNINENGFRPLYHNYCVFNTIDFPYNFIDYPGKEISDKVLTFGYVDAGACKLLIVAYGQESEGNYRFFNTSNEGVISIEAEEVKENEFVLVDIDKDRYQSLINDIHSKYETNPEIQMSREITMLDASRSENDFDTVVVQLNKEGLDSEEIEVKIDSLLENLIVGKIVKEPKQDFGYHKNDKIGFYIQQITNGQFACFADVSPEKTFTKEQLADGSILEEAIDTLYQQYNEKNVYEVFALIRDSEFLVPCSYVVKQPTKSRFEDLIKDTEGNPEKILDSMTIGEDKLRLRNDVLKRGDKYLFPVFTSLNQMDLDYEQQFTMVKKDIFEVIGMCNTSEPKVSGIIVNGFSQAFEINWEMCEVIKKLNSRIK